MRQGTPVQQVTVSEDFRPWRLAVDFRDAAPVDVRPLVPRLDFITDPDCWGFPFRRGLFEISADDFAVVATAMGDG
ncbi:MAG: hypothetical protein L0H93_13860 [Nocardioides sp.]|nr:hypothetical protein [Nocardioides sp.]